jgi:glycosyltransferase involved in cell wall biosynthesis
MKLFEYMAAGRAILSGDLPVLREVLNESNGLLLPTEDVQAWVDGLSGLLADPDRMRSLGKQARLDAAAYTWEARAARMLAGI